MFAICNLTLVPVRKESSDRSEMVSQLLFGDIIEILDKHKSWYKVKMLADDYIGWIDQKQVALITDEEKANYDAQSSFISNDILQIAILNNSEMSTIVMGSTLPFYSNKKLSFGGNNYSFEGNTVMVSSKRPDNITLQAQLYLNSPYLWGGRSPFGIDCSGLTQIVYKICGYKLPRDAIQQAEQGETISFLEETIPGDLAFFDNEEGKIIHVGIITHGSNIIHASGKVRMDKLDHQGIFNAETKKYSHKLRLIKRHIS